MAQTCPLLFRSVDGTIARLNSISIALVVVASLLTQESVLLLLLSIDFMIRLYGKKSFSPIFLFSKFLKKMFKIKDDMVDAGAKRLAAHFGLGFSVLLFVSMSLSISIATYLLSAIFLSCVFLELAFSYCVGCQVYFIIKKIYPGFMEV